MLRGSGIKENESAAKGLFEEKIKKILLWIKSDTASETVLCAFVTLSGCAISPWQLFLEYWESVRHPAEARSCSGCLGSYRANGLADTKGVEISRWTVAYYSSWVLWKGFTQGGHSRCRHTHVQTCSQNISRVKSSVANRCVESKKKQSHSLFEVPSYCREVNTLDSGSLMFIINISPEAKPLRWPAQVQPYLILTFCQRMFDPGRHDLCWLFSSGTYSLDFCRLFESLVCLLGNTYCSPGHLLLHTAPSSPSLHHHSWLNTGGRNSVKICCACIFSFVCVQFKFF